MNFLPEPRSFFARWPWKPLAVGVAITVAAVLALRWGSRQENTPSGKPDLAYAAHIELRATAALRAETMMAGSVYYIDGRIQNRGPLPISFLTARLQFFDPFGQIAQVANRPIVDAASGLLKPGESRSFRLGFSHISALWNQAPPAMRPVSIFVMPPAKR